MHKISVRTQSEKIDRRFLTEIDWGQYNPALYLKSHQYRFRYAEAPTLIYSTFGVLRHYADLDPTRYLPNMHALIDIGPPNGMTLDARVH